MGEVHKVGRIADGWLMKEARHLSLLTARQTPMSCHRRALHSAACDPSVTSRYRRFCASKGEGDDDDDDDDETSEDEEEAADVGLVAARAAAARRIFCTNSKSSMMGSSGKPPS